MRITRHTAADMRQALRAVRAQLGPDAVILSSQRTAKGVEVTAAMDFDAANAAVRDPPTLAPAPKPASAPTPAPSPSLRADATFMPPATETMGQELKSLRRMLETQVAQLAWNDLSRRAPIHAEMLRELTEVGLDQDLAATVVAQLPPGADLSQARHLTSTLLSQDLLVTGDRWLDTGGRVALIGPTGVGKTTTLAKLAVRWILRHGTRDLALVAGDSFRIGAQAQLQSLGQLLGVPVHPLDDLSELPQVLARLSRYRFVLVDTPGSSQRDPQLAQRISIVGALSGELESALVLAASTQAGAVAETVRRFSAASPSSCVLTKLDEAASLGGVLSVLLRSKLPISYVSEGQRVPEDLRPARAQDLVTSAVRLAQITGAAADEELLKRRFGDVAHGFA